MNHEVSQYQLLGTGCLPSSLWVLNALYSHSLNSSLPSIFGIVSSHKGTNQCSEYPPQISRVLSLYRSLLSSLCSADISHLGFPILSAALSELRDSNSFPWVPSPVQEPGNPLKLIAQLSLLLPVSQGSLFFTGRSPVSSKLLFHIFCVMVGGDFCRVWGRVRVL